MPLQLNVVVASTRPGRAGIHVANWFLPLAQAHTAFDARLVDLVDVALPLYDEPNHPVQRKYVHEHTKRWSASVAAADAFVFVVPEYNYGPTPALLNALDYVYHEWSFKPAAFVSYGGLSGGLRGVQQIKPILTTLNVMPIPSGVMIQWIRKRITDGAFVPEETHVESVRPMLDALARWATALKPMRD
jgi:NAD(P)H-dependent FMN reductase